MGLRFQAAIYAALSNVCLLDITFRTFHINNQCEIQLFGTCPCADPSINIQQPNRPQFIAMEKQHGYIIIQA